MPRSNRPRRARSRTGRRPQRPDDGATELDTDRALYGTGRRETHPDGEWLVRPVGAASATKTYRCPGCDQEIPPGTGHVVAWPAEEAVGAFGGVHDRRHWHRPCWTARDRRR